MGVGASETSSRRASGPDGAGKQRLEGRAIQRRAAPERIENQRSRPAVDADQEVPRETDARGAEAEAAGDLEVED